MRLAISNIAWNVSADKIIARLLRRFKIDAIDIAPGKYFDDPPNAPDSEIARLKASWEEIEITGMQSLLFGTKGFNLFGFPKVQKAMLQYLTGICRIAAGLGAKQLVFGSPKNRDRKGLTDGEAKEIAGNFFQRLGDIAKSFGVTICLEPIHASYGANFMTTSVETAEMVEQIAHPAIKMQLDTGALTMSGEDLATTIQKYARLIGHIHISEPQLVPLNEKKTDHHAIAQLLEKNLPTTVACIEMQMVPDDELYFLSIERSFELATQYYRKT